MTIVITQTSKEQIMKLESELQQAIAEDGLERCNKIKQAKLADDAEKFRVKFANDAGTLLNYVSALRNTVDAPTPEEKAITNNFSAIIAWKKTPSATGKTKFQELTEMLDGWNKNKQLDRSLIKGFREVFKQIDTSIAEVERLRGVIVPGGREIG